jgi:hypothetical protein
MGVSVLLMRVCKYEVVPLMVALVDDYNVRVWCLTCYSKDSCYAGQFPHVTGHASLAATFPVPTLPHLCFFPFTQLQPFFWRLFLFRTVVLQVDESKHSVGEDEIVGTGHGPMQIETRAAVPILCTLILAVIPVPSKFLMVYVFPLLSFATSSDSPYPIPSPRPFTTVTRFPPSFTPELKPDFLLKFT